MIFIIGAMKIGPRVIDILKDAATEKNGTDGKVWITSEVSTRPYSVAEMRPWISEIAVTKVPSLLTKTEKN